MERENRMGRLRETSDRRSCLDANSMLDQLQECILKGFSGYITDPSWMRPQRLSSKQKKDLYQESKHLIQLLKEIYAKKELKTEG